MEQHQTKANPNSPISGYDFARAVLNQPGIDGVETLLAAAHGGETDWLEKKAGVYPSVEHDPMFRTKLEKCPPDKVAEETRFYEAEILRTIASAVVALYNSRGGVVLIGIDDSNNPVPFETCDPDGLLKKHGLEAYVREAIVERVFPDNGEFQCKKETWSIPAKSIGVIPKLVPYRGNSILALLVPSLKHGVAPVLVSKIENNRRRKILLQREVGDIGAVRKEVVEVNWSNNVAALADFHDERAQAFLSNTDLIGFLVELGITPPSYGQFGFRNLPPLRWFYMFFVTTLVVFLVVYVSGVVFHQIVKPDHKWKGDSDRQINNEDTNAQVSDKFDNKAWAQDYLDSLRKTLSSAQHPVSVTDGQIAVHTNETLLSGDIPNDYPFPKIVLDGGTLLISPAIHELAAFAERCEALIANTPDETDISFPDLPKVNVIIRHPIFVTSKGGRIDTVDGEVHAKVIGPIRCADNAESAELYIFGFSSITLNRSTLDHRLDITGCGRVADIDESGRVRNLKWFDYDDPLILEKEPATSKPIETISATDRSAIESFLLAHFAMMQGGDFLSFYNVLPSTWRQALDESIPALVEKCPDVEFALFMDATQTFYRSWALHATWKAEANNTSNLQNGYTKTEIHDMVLRYSASALAIAEAATTNSLRKGNLSTLLSLPPAELPAGIEKPAPYNARKPTFRFESKEDGSVIVTPTPYLNQPLRMVKIDGIWVSEYWAGCFKDCESWKSSIENIRMTSVRRLWLMKNLIVYKGLAKAGEEASTSAVALWVDYWAQFARNMCRSTFFDDSFRPAYWKRVYECYSKYAAYPKLSPTYGEPEEINLLNNDPAFMDAPMHFHPDAESERKAAEEAERERLRRLAASTNAPPVVRDAEKDVEWIGRSLLRNENAYPTNSIIEK